MKNFSLLEVFGSLQKVAPYLPINLSSNRLHFGEHRSQFRSDGHDFYQIREYDPEEDSVSQILWRLRGPDGKLFVREARATKEFSVVVMGDLSASICFSAGYPYKQRMLLETVGNIGLTAFHGQDPCGFIGFAEDIIFNESPRISKDYVYYLAEQLYDFFQSAMTDGGLADYPQKGTDFYKAFDFFSRHYPNKRSLLIVISDFVGLEDLANFQLLKDLAQQHEVVFIFLDDPTEFQLAGAGGYLRLENMESGRQVSIPARKLKALGDISRQRRRAMREELREINVDSVVLEYGKHFQRLFRFLLIRREIFRS